MEDLKILNYIKDVIKNMPSDWLTLTTHRLDIYDEKQAKTQFLERFEALYTIKNATSTELSKLPTAYDYIRLGHPLSCILEWTIAKSLDLEPQSVISFSSKTTPILAILRRNLLTDKSTKLFYIEELPTCFNAELVQNVYGYNFELIKISDVKEVDASNHNNTDCSKVLITSKADFATLELNKNIDFYISTSDLGSILVANGNEGYISEIQHVRRRETIAMTPANSLDAIKGLINHNANVQSQQNVTADKQIVLDSIIQITGTKAKPLVASSGLSMQYAIMMGLIHDAQENHSTKAIKFVVPPNCYGGTNDQARRVAACLNNVEVVDLPVDGDNDMVQSINRVLEQIANEDAVPYIIAEIPTNPRVEVPDLLQLKEVLSAQRKTKAGKIAIDPVFILDQTFCPNVHFLGEGEILSTVRAISYASGSKFPSGGKCTAGYCVSNHKAEALMLKIEQHLALCDNEATSLQMKILANQLPSMNQRISDAYKNTREFVSFIQQTLPNAKINFVSESLAVQGFTPSVFSLDLPTKGETAEDKELYKRELNHKLIQMMIKEIPDESKYCVSYGQLKGCYWTIPATSTQGTTKEGDKDYIARVALSGNMNLELHKKVFKDFVDSI